MLGKTVRGTMKSFLILLAAASAAAGACAADMHDMPMAMPPGMVMKMIDPMPALYMGEADKPGAPVFKGLGDHHHPVTTKNARTQLLFDQGVNLIFGFNHAEAIRSFREAARLDPHCAMCWWGVAFSLGPNINLTMPADAVKPAWQALQNAIALKRYASPQERAWIDALAVRYSSNPDADRAALDEDFARAMGAVWKAYPNDLDAGTFYAEAMMDTQPWDYWGQDGVTPKGHALEIVSTLEGIIKRAPKHPGALHLYIHAVEATTTPERAEVASDTLETLMPGAGHVVHMPSHIYYRVGRYADSAKVNALAATVDEQYIAACHAQGYYPVGYYGHNIHFLWTSSEMQGNYKTSIDTARRLVKASAGGAKSVGVGAQLYEFTPVVTYLRFGKWDEALAEPLPPNDQKLTLVMAHLARGFAYANKGDKANAAGERAALAALVGDPVLAGYQGLPGALLAKLSLAELDGEIARTAGDLKTAVDDFEMAVGYADDIPYSEPPYLHQPASHLLGAALLQAGRAKEAETVYRKSLETYRMDGWALYGLAQAQDAMGEHAAAAATRKEFALAWQFADVKLATSRF
jgi:tetratricopeptide (TPR) repeat protein